MGKKIVDQSVHDALLRGKFVHQQTIRAAGGDEGVYTNGTGTAYVVGPRKVQYPHVTWTPNKGSSKSAFIKKLLDLKKVVPGVDVIGDVDYDGGDE